MTRDEAHAIADRIEASWPPFNLLFYSVEEIIAAVIDLSFDGVNHAIDSLVTVDETAPPLWILRELSQPRFWTVPTVQHPQGLYGPPRQIEEA